MEVKTSTHNELPVHLSGLRKRRPKFIPKSITPKQPINYFSEFNDDIITRKRERPYNSLSRIHKDIITPKRERPRLYGSHKDIIQSPRQRPYQ